MSSRLGRSWSSSGFSTQLAEPPLSRPDVASGTPSLGVPLLYDASRLCTRVLNPTPNGIDRLDALLCRGLLGASAAQASALVFGWRGPRLLSPDEGMAALTRAERMWGEHDRAHAGHIALPALSAWLRGTGDERTHRVVEPRRGRIGAALTALRRLGLRRGQKPEPHAPHSAIYVNATHFPLDWPTHVAWLARRRDIRPVIFIHDLLPLDRPDLFWPGETERHRRRLAVLARHGAGAIVTTKTVATRLGEEMARAGRPDLPILDAQPPVADVFHAPARRDPALAEASYFIVCGTIEPRKNHRLLLRVWRRLVAERGARAPKLVVVGKRGWLCDDIIAEMADPALGRHVIEVTSLTSGDYRLLLDHARALLAPSLAEGFGLPVAEALAVGTPVIASDIPPFREQRTEAMTLIALDAETDWYDAIAACADQSTPARADRAETQRITPKNYLGAVSSFLRGLA